MLARRRRDHRADKAPAWPWLSVPAAVLAFALTPVPAAARPADPVGSADQAVAEAQQRADQAAGAYLDARERAGRLDAQVTQLQEEMSALEARVAELRRIARARAVEAYKRSSTPFSTTFGDGKPAMDATRRSVLLDVLNARDDAAADQLRRSRDALERHHRDLESARQELTDTIARLHDEEQRLNSELVAAQSQRQRVVQQQAAAAAPRPPSGSSPAPVIPPNYSPNTGVHPHHDDPFLACTRQRESGGNYQAYNPSGPYYGAYQFDQSTWNSTANHAGRGELVGLDPRQASEYDQDDMAWDLYQWRGKAPWGGRC